MIVNETDAWDYRWVRMVASFIDVSWAPLSPLQQRACIREWSYQMIAEHERNQVRLLVASVFLDDPVRVMFLRERWQIPEF